jgi:hypothetical protein
MKRAQAASLAAFLLLALSVAGPVQAQEKFGVFIGINDYIAYEDEPGGDLQGAEQDALLMRAVLQERWGLPAENTLTLLSREATKEAIRASLTEWMAERVTPGDLAIFYFAGHGAQAFDLDGDEPDGLDETLAPTDILPLSSENDIRDDEFRRWLLGVGTEVIVILDSCHSGTATRGGRMRTRSLDRPVPSEGGREPERVRQQYDSESMIDGGTTITELAAAAPNQSAMEGDFRSGNGPETEARGAFTYHLVRQLWQASPSTTYEDLLSYLSASLQADQFTQSPQLTGRRTGSLFRNTRSKSIADFTSTDVATRPVRLPKAALPGSSETGAGPAEFTSTPLVIDVSAVEPSTRETLRREFSGHTGVELSEGLGPLPDLYVLTDETLGSLLVVGKDGQRLPAASVDQGLVGIVRSIESAWAAKALSALTNSTQPFAIELLTTRVANSETAVVSVTSEKEGYLTLITLGADVGVTIHRQGPGLNRVREGEPVEVRLDTTTGDLGVDGRPSLVLALVTPAPLDITPGPGLALAHEVLTSLRRSLEAVTARSDSSSLWNGRLTVLPRG